MKTLRVAMIIPDNRDERRQYELNEPQFGPAPTALLMGLQEREDIELHVLATTRRPMTAPEKIGKGIHYHLLDAGPFAGLSGVYLPAVLRLRREIQRLQPDVVHGQGTERYCALGAAFSGKPNLVTIHGNMRAIARLHRARPFTYLWITARLESLALRRTGGVLCLTRHSLREVQGLAKKTWLLPNAVDPEFFQVQRQPSTRPWIVCPANIVVLKNHLKLIDALAPLAKTYGLTLVFAGGGNPRDPYFQAFKQRLAQNPWCQHEGFWNRPQLLEGLSKATMVILPSLEDNCPMAILEAMAAGVPVAASHVGGIPDLIEDGVTGVLFDPLQEECIRQRVQMLLDQPEWRNQLAVAARRKAQEHHTPRVVAAGHMNIYRELLESSL